MTQTEEQLKEASDNNKETITNNNKFELNSDFKKRMNLNYSDFDSQKGNLSPRLLFRKRKNDYSGLNDSHIKNNHSTDNNKQEFKNFKIATKLKESFDNLMDFVYDTYFTTDKINENNNSINNETGFKFTSLDLLINPLRQKFTWETWSPYEIALFHCCICKFGPKFDFFENIVSDYKFIYLFILD
jgi:hypothetical protein